MRIFFISLLTLLQGFFVFAGDKILSVPGDLVFSPSEGVKASIVVTTPGEYKFMVEPEKNLEIWIFEKKNNGRLDPLVGNLSAGKPQGEFKIKLELGKNYTLLGTFTGPRNQESLRIRGELLQFAQLNQGLKQEFVLSKTPSTVKELPLLVLQKDTSAVRIRSFETGPWILENGPEKPKIWRYSDEWSEVMPYGLPGRYPELGELNGNPLVVGVHETELLSELSFKLFNGSRWINHPLDRFSSPFPRGVFSPGSDGSFGFWETTTQGKRLKILKTTPDGFQNLPGNGSSSLWAEGAGGLFQMDQFQNQTVVSILTADKGSSVWRFSGNQWLNLEAVEVKNPTDFFLTASSEGIYAGWQTSGILQFQVWNPAMGWRSLPEVPSGEKNSAVSYGGDLWVLQVFPGKVQVLKYQGQRWETFSVKPGDRSISYKEVKILTLGRDKQDLWACLLEEQNTQRHLRLFQIF